MESRGGSKRKGEAVRGFGNVGREATVENPRELLGDLRHKALEATRARDAWDKGTHRRPLGSLGL